MPQLERPKTIHSIDLAVYYMLVRHHDNLSIGHKDRPGHYILRIDQNV